MASRSPPFLLRSGREPLPDLLDLRKELSLDVPGLTITRRRQSTPDLRGERVSRFVAVRCPAQLGREAFVAPHGAPTVARDPGDDRLAVSALQALEHSENFPHGHLSIGHPRMSR